MHAYVSNMFRGLPTLMVKHIFVANYRSPMMLYAFKIFFLRRSDEIAVTHEGKM